MCNKKLGTPFDRCQRVFDGAVADCKAKLGPLFGGICNLAYIVGALCYIVKPLDFICMLVSYAADTIVDAVRKKIKRFTRHIKAMFYVKVKFSHSFHFEANQTKTLEDVSTSIITEVRSRTDKFLAVFDWMSFMTTFFIFFMLLRVMHYRHKWLTSERFDNQYLTDDLRTIDLIRTRQDKETILPLNPRERNQYIPLTSVTLIKIEKVKLAKSVVFLGLTTFKICIHMVADYSLYWILSTIRHHGRIEMKVQRPNSVGVYVSGNGYLADLYRSIVKAFTPHAKDTEIDLMPCLPDPIPPDLDRYTQIATLIVFCWIMAIFEPYGLRLRHVVMCKYHPERARQRAAWLYNHIIRSRGSFLKFARRQLRRKFGMTEGERIEKVTFRERCLAICPFLNKLFPRKQNMCLLCGAPERPDQEPHIKCATPGCVGLFCIRCFEDLQNLCTICRSPIEYGDLSDMSEERDSSDDQLITMEKLEPTIRKEKPVVKEEPEDEIKVEKIAEEIIPEVIILEEKMPEERTPEEELEERKMQEEKILEEKVEEEVERIDVKKKDEAVQTDDDIDKSSSDSIYSYTYQDESSREIITREIKHCKAPFKDVEAQKIREDVTIQIFNDSLAREITSSSEDPTSCFVVRARRRLRTRLKRKSHSSPRKDDTSSSTSIADTESWPTEELDEEEVIHIEVDDGSKELLLKDGAAIEKKRSHVRRILAALMKIPWLGKATKANSDGEWRTRKPSLIDRIVRMLPGNQFASPIRTYRRIRTMKKDAKREDSSSASSSSSDEKNEQSALLKTHLDRQVDCLRISPDHDDSEANVYSRNYDSHRARRRTICRQPDSRARAEAKLKYPHEKKFAMKKLPRYLQPIAKNTSYFEEDEIKDSQPKWKCSKDRIHILLDTKTSVVSQRTDKWNIASDNHISCSCTSQISCVVKEDSQICQSDRNVITEQSDKIFEPEEMSEIDRGLQTVNWRRSDQEKETGEIVSAKKTLTDIEADRQKTLEKIAIGDDRRKSLTKNNEGILKLNVTEEKNMKKYSINKEQSKKLEAKENAATSTLRASDKTELYDPLASLELHGVTYQARRREKSTEEKLTKQPEIAETRIDDGKVAESIEFKKGIEMLQKDRHIRARKIRKSKEIPEKSIQTNIRKFKMHKKSDRTPHTSARISEATNLERERKRKEERGWEKWINKCNRYQKSESDTSPPQRKLCNKATLIKEKQYRRKKEQQRTRDHDVQTQEYSCARQEEGSYTNRIDDVRRRRFAPAFRSITGLNENRQTQCNLRDREVIQRRQDGACALKFTNEPEVWSCNVQRFKAPEQIIHCCSSNYWDQRKYLNPCDERITRDPYRCDGEIKNTYMTEVLHDADVQSYPTKISLGKELQQIRKKKYDVNVRETRLEIPMLKKYLPAYQTPGLIEELKEHDRMRLIQEREARRWMALNAFRTKNSLLSAKSRNRASCGASILCDDHESISGQTSVSTKLTEGNTLPYQETQAFKDVVCEFRNKVIGTEKSLISLSQRADKHKDLRQLFPPKNENRREVTAFDKVVNTFKERERNATYKTKGRFQSESLSETSSIYGHPCKHHQSYISTSADETENNDIT
ncbi:trichohyalin-like isoform X1 [Linepithema humile]|uniref:trichohyalin-like isoform X1 n=1 Tax=Linepithema humile TaxID=83485 RepID=UPI00351E9869